MAVIKNLTKEQHVRFDKLNLIHPKKMKPNENTSLIYYWVKNTCI